MPDAVTKTPEKKEPKKGVLANLKDKMEDSEEQLAILSTFVRLGILVWSGGILTLAYIKLPPALGIPEQKLDPTFIPVFTGVWRPLAFRQPRVRMETEAVQVEEESPNRIWRN